MQRMREEGRISDVHGKLRKTGRTSNYIFSLFSLMVRHHSPPHASVLTDIDFQEITSCFIHCSKLKRMIELVAVAVEYVSHGTYAVHILLKAYLCMMSLLDMVQYHGSTAFVA